MSTKKEKGNFKLGIFVVLGLALFIGTLYYLGKQRNLFGENVQVVGIFYDVDGLQVGNNIRFSGINIGTVEGVSIISDSTVMVTMVLKKEVTQFIKKDAEAIIGSEGLMGNKVINIMAGGRVSQSPIENGDTLLTLTPASIDEITNNLQLITANAAIVSEDLAGITGKISKGEGLVGRLLYDKRFADDITATTSNLRKGSARIGAIANEAEEVVEGTKGVVDAAQNSVLFRGYFRKKEKQEQKEREERLEKIEKKERAKRKKAGKSTSADSTQNAIDADTTEDGEQKKKRWWKFGKK